MRSQARFGFLPSFLGEQQALLPKLQIAFRPQAGALAGLDLLVSFLSSVLPVVCDL